MSFSPLKIRLAEPLRDAKVKTGRETYLSEGSIRKQLEDRFHSGFEAGQKALGEELVKQRTQLLEIQNNILRSVESALPTVAVQCEKDLIGLAMEAARRIVQDLPISAELVETVLKNGIAEMKGASEYDVHLHPDDYTLLQTIQSPVLPAPGTGKTRFVPDSSITRTGCSIRSRHGTIEIDREKMFQKLQAAAL